jgi:hypothetical protein
MRLSESTLPASHTRHHFWELDCLSKDFLLSLAFDPQEMQNLYAEAYPEQGLPTDPASAEEVFIEAHRFCHCQTQLAWRVEQQLNQRYAKQIEQVAGASLGAISNFVQTTDVHHLAPLAGWLWAVLSDSRRDLLPIKRLFLHRIKACALKTLAFGKVHLLPVSSHG